MRCRAVLPLPLLVVALLVPVGSGQEAATPVAVEVATDGPGDVRFQAGDAGAQDSPLPREDLDLLSLTVTEQPEGFRIALGVSSLDEQSSQGELFSLYTVDFTHHDTQYRVAWFRSNSLANGAYFSELQVFSPATDRYSYLQELTPEVDAGAATIAAVAPRDQLLDGQGAPPYPGRALSDFFALALGNPLLAGNFDVAGQSAGDAYLVDRMPDDGLASTPVPVVLGVQQTGHARLWSEEPFRFSNGEATTFVFRVQAHNNDTAPDTFDLRFSQAPDGWDIRTPASTIRIEGGGTVEVPVVVRTEFAHDHGNSDRVLMEMVSQRDPSAVGRIEIGVHYPATPQPAGHHDTVYFHSTDNSDQPINLLFGTVFGTIFGNDNLHAAWMNTVEDFAGDDDAEVGGDRCQSDVVTMTWCWDLDLDPELKMGLDFDLDDVGEISAPVSSILPLPGATLHGAVMYEQPPEDEEEWWNTESVEVATLVAADPVEVGANGQETLTATVVPSEAGDFLPYTKGASLWIRLMVTAERPDNPFFGPGDHPKLQPGGWARLPLLEYEDPVDEVFGTGGAIALVADKQQRMVNPGETVLYKVALQNLGALEDAFRIGYAGSNEAWVTLLSNGAVTLAAGEDAEVRLAVSAPEDADDDARADIILEAQSASDPNTRALLRILTTVDTDEDHPDESDLAGLGKDDGKDTSGPALAAILALLATIAVARPRR